MPDPFEAQEPGASQMNPGTPPGQIPQESWAAAQRWGNDGLVQDRFDAPRRTPAEQAAFDARVAEEVRRKRGDVDKDEVERVASQRHDELVAREAEAAKQRQADEEKAKERAAALAEFNAHPHTQLTGILTDLRRPSGLDVNARMATLHNAVARLAQLMLGSGEAPIHPDHQETPDEEQRRIEEQPVVRPEGPFPSDV